MLDIYSTIWVQTCQNVTQFGAMIWRGHLRLDLKATAFPAVLGSPMENEKEKPKTSHLFNFNQSLDLDQHRILCNSNNIGNNLTQSRCAGDTCYSNHGDNILVSGVKILNFHHHNLFQYLVPLGWTDEEKSFWCNYWNLSCCMPQCQCPNDAVHVCPWVPLKYMDKLDMSWGQAKKNKCC